MGVLYLLKNLINWYPSFLRFKTVLRGLSWETLELIEVHLLFPKKNQFFPDLDSVFLPSPLTQEPISIILDDELLDSQPKFALPPSSLSDLPPLVDSTLEKSLEFFFWSEIRQSYHQDLAADEYMYKPTINEATRVTEHDIPVSTLSRPGKSNSLCKDKTETVIFEKYESFPVSL